MRFLNQIVPLFLSLLIGSFQSAHSFAQETVPVKEKMSLESCLKHAINHNPGVKIAQSIIKGSKGEEYIFWSTILPNLNAGVTTPPATISAKVEQKIYDYGTPARYRATQYQIAAAKANYELAINEAIFDVREAYARALASQKDTEILEAYAQELEKSLRTVDLQFEAAKITKNEVQRLHVRTSLARRSADQSSVETEQRQNNLLRLSGLPLKPVQLESNENFELPQLVDVEKLTQVAFQQRRDLYTLENIKLSSSEQIKIIQSLNLPLVNANAVSATDPGRLGFRTGYRTVYVNEFERVDDLNSDVFSRLDTAAILHWRIYDGGQIRGAIQTARADVIQQEALLQRIRINIPSQVKTALELVKIAHEQWKNTQTTDPEAALESAQEDFNAGKTKQLDLLDTQESVVGLRISRSAAENNLSLSKALLDRATGLGIRFVQDPEILKK